MGMGFTRVVVALNHLPPAKVMVAGYLSYILIGWLLLCLPISWKGASISAIDNLFTATSAVSTTGLTTISTSGSYSFFGQVVVLTLIQLGGIGYMTIGSFVVLARGRELSDFRENVSRTTFSLPDGTDTAGFVRRVVEYTLIVEAVGMALLYILFVQRGVPDPLWQATFHSVSAFCTAGFSLFDTSLEAFRGDVWVNLVIMTLSYLGAIGFLLANDLWMVATGRSPRLSLTSRLILHTTGWMTILGTLMLMVIEPSFQTMTVVERLLASLFQTMTAMTTVGFNTSPIGSMSMASVMVLLTLMIIGASPSGTGGGIKCTTIAIAWSAIRATLRGDDKLTYWGRIIPPRRTIAAFALLAFYLLVLMLGTVMLMTVDHHSFENVLFETASALGTVGLSRGITAELEGISKFILVLVMFVGRVGPLSLVLALMAKPDTGAVGRAEDVAV